jgi:hypothetical protein
MHFTQGGNYGDAWVEPTLQWHTKFSKRLPQSTAVSSSQKILERNIGIFWLRRLTTEKISLKNKLKWIRVSNSWKNPRAWPFIALFLYGKKIAN